MKNFYCSCGQLLFFENTQCGQCGKRVAFDPALSDMQTLQTVDGQLRSENGRLYKPCRHSIDFNACNWLIDAYSHNQYCVSCRLNETVPDLSRPQNIPLWSKLETAKRRMVYTLVQLKLPVISRLDNPETGLAFAFLEDQRSNPNVAEQFVLTGHANGLITMNLLEADDINRENQRHSLGEAYRTLLGHFRHEIGHYYFDKYLRNSPHMDGFRQLFGNERLDYDVALQQYYRTQPAHDGNYYISAYAQSHPLEDWAETWAHYLHMADALETAATHKLIDADVLNAKFESRFKIWVELSIALNSLNRSIGLQDAYPFVLSSAVIAKLGFVEKFIQGISKN